MDNSIDLARKDANLQIRINSELKKKFEEKCKSKYTNRTSVLTDFVVEYINRK